MINRARPQVSGRRLLLAAVLVLVGCGESTLTTSRSGDTPDLRERPAYNPTSDRPDVGDDTPASSRCCVLVPANATELGVGVDGNIDLGVYLFSLSTGDPMPDEAIAWSLAGDTTAGGRLSAANAFTDLDGLAQIRFQGGLTPTTYTLTASHPGSNSVDYTVEVLDLPVGGIEVIVSHPSASLYDVSPISVRLFKRADLTCDFLAPGAFPADFFIEAELESTREQAVFENLLAGGAYTVVVTGFGELGERAAQACVDDVFVEENVMREVEVVLQLLPLNPVGEYDVQSWWDFTEALLETGSVGQIIVDILDLFEDPGDQILEYVLTGIEYFVGGLISSVVEIFLDVTGLDDLISDAINNLINSSDALRQFFSIGCDLRRMVTRLQVLSILSIGKIGSNFEVFGVDTWTGLAICDFTPDPDFVVGVCDDAPDCERINIVIDEDAGLGLLRGDWTGRVLSYNQLIIDRHAIDFNYGRLILFVLENWVFPFLTGDEPPVTFEDVVGEIINCEGIADYIGDICAFGDCITEADIEGFCDGAVSLIFGTLFEAFVNALSFDSVLELRGEATLVNLDTDLDIELIEDGQYVGTIFVDEDGSPFDADFEGQRRERDAE